MAKSAPTFVTDWTTLELPRGLDHLRVFLPGDAPMYRSAPWLNDYESEVWEIDLHSRTTLDWRVRVGTTGTLLTSPDHAELWTALRSWLVVQTHHHVTGRVEYTPKTAYNSLRRVLFAIDYLLLDADRSGLERFGLTALTSNYWLALVSTIIEEGSSDVSVYRWPEKLTALLRERVVSVTDDDVTSALAAHPDLAPRLDVERATTHLTEDETIRARVWLWNSDLYLEQRQHGAGKYRPNVSALARMLYADTLIGSRSAMRVPEELLVGERSTRVREMRVSRKEVARGRGWTRQYGERFAASISTLRLLSKAGFAAPALDRDELLTAARAVEARSEGRHRTLPCSVVFHALNRAIEYVMLHGEDLADSFVSLAKCAHTVGRSITVYSATNDITPHLTWRTRQLGVTRWSVDRTLDGSYLTRSLSPEEYFRQLRGNVGLWDSMQLLVGACKIVIGSLMARRQDELISLRAGSCLDASATRLIFRKGKSGVGPFRERDARPIHPVGVTCVKLLEGIQSLLVQAGVLNAYTGLFHSPSIAANAGLLSEAGASRYYDNVDLFCDYAEVPCDAGGARYYLRQHQLRRWFAMMFFWGNSFGGVETLRWFLGHTDQQHLYHYITESTPGSVLVSVAAEWAVEGMRRSTPETESLAALVLEHFGAASFHIFEDEVVETYVQGLLEDKTLIIEPIFLDSGRTCRIAVRLSYELQRRQ